MDTPQDVLRATVTRIIAEGGEVVTEITPSERLEYLRGELRAERMSYGELAELQSLAEHIDPSDLELREAAGLPEHDEAES